MKIKEDGSYKYIETAEGKEVILILHGLLGALSNFQGIIDKFKDDYNIVVPILPIMEMPLKKVGLYPNPLRYVRVITLPW